MEVAEYNFDGIVGPTHNFAGLSFGNLASMEHQEKPSNPKAGALQGLHKMKLLASLGIHQAIFPPHQRPHIPTLRQLGFAGSDKEILEQVGKEAPHLLTLCSSTSAMWTANAATVTPSVDSSDGKVHLTPANLAEQFHRSIEANTTQRILNTIFCDPNHFIVHDYLPSHTIFADEGAANHTRLSCSHRKEGVALFVYGRSVATPGLATAKRYPARQTLEASQTIARSHGTNPKRRVFAQQNPVAIDAGVFHNDVISTGNGNLFLYHEQAFADTEGVIQELRKALATEIDCQLMAIPVPANRVSLEDAVKSYLFNSQIITLPDSTMALIAAEQCREIDCVRKFIEDIVEDGTTPLCAVHYVDLRESMANGGGPACLRLRMVMNEEERHGCNPHIFLDNALYERLLGWVEHHYRDRLVPTDLCDPNLLLETRTALDELTHILGLGSIYSFQ